MAKESYSQIAYLHVIESAANTLTFAGLSVFSNVLSQKGMIIHRCAYKPTVATVQRLATTGDTLDFGICGSDAISDVSLDDPEVYDNFRLTQVDFGAPANSAVTILPFVSDFSSLPGEGLLVPADRLFLYVQGTALGGVAELEMRMNYTLIDLAAADYLELAQAMRVLR